MQQLRSYASALFVVAALLSGCAGGSEDVESDGSKGGGPTERADADKVATVVYMIDLHREQDRAEAPMLYGVVPVSLPGTAVASGDLPANRERIADAVEALLHQPRGRHETLWTGKCAPGDGVSGVRIRDGQVTVILTGSAADSCDLDLAEAGLQAQQLAWTVVENSDLPPRVGVGFVDGSGKASERWTAGRTMVVNQ